MASARYCFSTSNFNWRNGALALFVAAGFFGLRQVEHSHRIGSLILAAIPAALSIPCFLARYTLMIDVGPGHVRSTSGFWPFVRTRYERVTDFCQLEITIHGGGRRLHYTLWLIGAQRRRISLADRRSWPKLNDVAQELAAVIGWPITDLTNGRNSLSAILRQ